MEENKVGKSLMATNPNLGQTGSFGISSLDMKRFVEESFRADKNH
jgi:hypothetical protein